MTVRFILSSRGGQNVNEWPLRCDALAYDNSSYDKRLLIISGIAAATGVKAISAALWTPQVNCRITGNLPGESVYQFGRDPAGYAVYRHKIGGNFWHMLAVSRCPTLLADMSEASVWARLRSDDYTTPMLRGWMPWLMADLLKRPVSEEDSSAVLRRANCFQCNAGLLEAEVEHVDAAVQHGVRTGQLKMV